jgi:hypothetical protein
MFIPFASPDSTTVHWLGKDANAWCICARQTQPQRNPSHMPQPCPEWLSPFTICQHCQALFHPPLPPPAPNTTTRCMSCNTNLNTVPRKLQCGTCHRCLHYPNPMRPINCASTSAQLKMLHPTLGWTCPICTLSIVKLVAHTYQNNRSRVLTLPNTQLNNEDRCGNGHACPQYNPFPGLFT